MNMSPSGLPGLGVVFFVVLATLSLVSVSPIVAIFVVSPGVAAIGAFLLDRFRRSKPPTHLDGLADTENPPRGSETPE